MQGPVDVIAMFRKAALEVDNRNLPELKAETVIARIGMDSVAIMELVSWFEEQLHVRLADEELRAITTVRDLRDALARALPPGTQVVPL